MDYTYRRGDICWFQDPEVSRNSYVKHGDRPVVIVSPDNNNLYNGLVIIVPLVEANMENRLYPGQFDIIYNSRRWRVDCYQIRVTDKSNLLAPTARMNNSTLDRLDEALEDVLGLVYEDSSANVYLADEAPEGGV